MEKIKNNNENWSSEPETGKKCMKKISDGMQEQKPFHENAGTATGRSLLSIEGSGEKAGECEELSWTL